MFADNAALKESKASYKSQYKTLLNEIGMDIDKGKSTTKISADSDILHSLKLLAEKVPVNINKWTPYVLANFSCCSFINDFNYLVAITDAENNLNGHLLQFQERCLAEGYEQVIKCTLGASGFDFNITFQNKVGGFLIVFNPRKHWPFSFGTLNEIGEKAMLEDFESLDKELQKHFISICKTCNGCQGCTKGGKNKIFAVHVHFDGKDYNLCPSFPQHGWESYDRKLIDVLFKYHSAQEKYGIDWKKR